MQYRMARLLLLIVLVLMAGLAIRAAQSPTDIQVAATSSCCQNRGDIDGDGFPMTTSDVQYFTSWLFTGGQALPCAEEANCDADPHGLVDEADYKTLLQAITYWLPLPPCTYTAGPTPPGGVVRLDSVFGIFPGTDQVMPDIELKFYIGVENDQGADLCRVNNGFRVYFPNGAEWSGTSGQLMVLFQEGLGSMQTWEAHVTGSDEDSLGFLTFANEECLEAGFEGTAYVLTIGPIDAAYAGDTICIDSCWHRPRHGWRWGVGGYHIPSWDGSHCFEVASSCCVPPTRGNVDMLSGPGGDVDVSDLTFLVAYLFTGGPTPPCIEEGNVDGITGVGGPIDVSDLTHLVAYLFTSGPVPVACP